MIKEPDKSISKKGRRFDCIIFGEKKERTSKLLLQSNWEGPYCVVKKLNDVVFASRTNIKIVHSDKLAPYAERRSGS